MKLIEFLASGVNGAENGTATFVLRGTASSAASVLYNDFEAVAQPGTNIITLDSHGAAEVYCNAYVDVTLKTSGGATLRTVTVGNTATTTEVISDSFTGTAYTGSPTAASQPIALSSVLDKWNNSAGTLDWKVLVGGVATNLSSAFAALAGIFFNVKDSAFGAAGDGVTDDTTAITLAITAAAAAGGGIVYFPSSTSFYKYTTLTVSSANITLMGAGPRASVLKSASTSTNIVASGAATGDWVRLIGLSTTCTGAGANPIIQIGSGVKCLIENVEVNGASLTGTCIRKTSGSVVTLCIIRDSQITAGLNCTGVIVNAANDGKCNFKILETKIIIDAGFTSDIISGPDFYVSGCKFDASAVTSGIYRHVNATSGSTPGKYIGRFVGNTFIDGGSTGFAFQLTLIAADSDFEESSNKFEGFTDPQTISSAGQIYNVSHNSQASYKIHLGSRVGRTIRITHASTGTAVLSALTAYQNLFVDYTAAGNLTIQAPISTMTNGAEANLVLQNNNASTRTITIDYGETPQTYGPLQATTGSDLAISAATGERVVAMMKFMPLGTGAPLAFIPSPVCD